MQIGLGGQKPKAVFFSHKRPGALPSLVVVRKNGAMVEVGVLRIRHVQKSSGIGSAISRVYAQHPIQWPRGKHVYRSAKSGGSTDAFAHRFPEKLHPSGSTRYKSPAFPYIRLREPIPLIWFTWISPSST